MPTVWIYLKRSLHCKSAPSDVHDPKSKRQLRAILTRKARKSGCSRSIANLKDVIHGSTRRLERPPSCSPRSIGSNEFLNPITHEVILSNSRCELKITGFGGCQEEPGDGGGSAFVGTLRPGMPGPGGHPTMHYFNPAFRASTNQRKEGFWFGGSAIPGGGGRGGSKGTSAVTCHRGGEEFGKWETLEAHHLSKHAVTELVEGDSSRKIVEIICQTSWQKSESHSSGIDKVLRVHNIQKTLARFEEYRETVKLNASKLTKKHPRCLADGNELLRFYGTTVACSLGSNGTSRICTFNRCRLCRIIRSGFSTKEDLTGGIGVFTTSTSERAFESISLDEDEDKDKDKNKNKNETDSCMRKALIVCRVIAGRVHKPLENIQEIVGQAGFDSLAGKMGLYANIEELYLLDPRALLPCFVVTCKP